MNKTDESCARVILFTAPGCAFCPIVSKAFATLQEQGLLGAFEKYDISINTDKASDYHVRTVPWFMINELEFTGAHSEKEIRYWIEHAGTDDGILRYISEALEAGRLKHIEDMIRKHHHWLPIALNIAADTDSPIQARIGLAALLEGLAGDELLQGILPDLAELVRHPDHRVRADACHYLGLIPSAQSIDLLKTCLNDEHAEVRELAQDGLELIQSD